MIQPKDVTVAAAAAVDDDDDDGDDVIDLLQADVIADDFKVRFDVVHDGKCDDDDDDDNDDVPVDALNAMVGVDVLVA